MDDMPALSDTHSLSWPQGEVPDHLIGYYDYITSLGPLDVPDYQWLLMQLDSGATGVAPARPPVRRQLADWPSQGEVYSRKDYALVSSRLQGRHMRLAGLLHRQVVVAADCMVGCAAQC